MPGTCPSGKSPNSRLALHVKIFRLTQRPNHCLTSARLTADEGRVAIVTNVAVGCGGRFGAQDEARLRRTAKPCGPDAPTLAFKSRRSICAVMVATKPGHQGERGVSR